MNINLVVYLDAVRVELQSSFGKPKLIGWYKDEVCAVSAAIEHLTIASHVFSGFRKLDSPITICLEQRSERSPERPVPFSRATTVRIYWNGYAEERRIIGTPGAYGKPWWPGYVAIDHKPPEQSVGAGSGRPAGTPTPRGYGQ